MLICPSCNGLKYILDGGGLRHDCATCNRVGYIDPDAPSAAPLMAHDKRSKSYKDEIKSLMSQYNCTRESAMQLYEAERAV